MRTQTLLAAAAAFALVGAGAAHAQIIGGVGGNVGGNVGGAVGGLGGQVGGSVGGQVGGAVDAGRLGDRVDQTTDRVEDTTDRVRDRARSSVDRVRGRVDSARQRVGDRARSTVDTVRSTEVGAGADVAGQATASPRGASGQGSANGGVRVNDKEARASGQASGEVRRGPK